MPPYKSERLGLTGPFVRTSVMRLTTGDTRRGPSAVDGGRATVMSSQLDMTRGATATLQRDTARKVFLQWMFSERLVELSAAEALFEKLRQEMDEDGSSKNVLCDLY